ncbi:MAG: ribonuclease HII, partial [Bacteroidales bacterium]|nr:ribonuclease HII [Bacteroidales bacterium]
MLLQKFFKEENIIECGCDEAGRGCLAGPVVAAAVVLPRDFDCKELNDSKQLSDSKRRLLRPIIEEKALAWAVAFVDNETIDRINILNASFLAMSNAVRNLRLRPDLLLIDGNRFKSDLDIPFECIVKGDGKFQSIAAASI